MLASSALMRRPRVAALSPVSRAARASPPPLAMAENRFRSCQLSDRFIGESPVAPMALAIVTRWADIVPAALRIAARRQVVRAQQRGESP